MTHADLETIYEALAIRLDAIPAQSREVFLAKLALLLAQEIGAPDKVLGMLDHAAMNLDP